MEEDDLPLELIHRIQLLLPKKEAVRTCVLSKSWLHAWSTRTLIRFCPPRKLLSSKQQLKTYTDSINRTLQRYHVHNIPITSFDLHFRIINHESLCFVNNWVRTVASTSFIKELYLTISVLESITLPDALFSGENLDTISVKADPYFTLRHSLLMSNNLIIKCVKLRVLELINVTLSDETLVKLLSTCILLEKINLSNCEGLTRIKVKNLHYLRELKITRGKRDSTIEIYDVPNLHIFKYNLLSDRNNILSNSLESVRELVLEGEIMDDAYSNIISKFPFLESLSLNIYSCELNKVDITSVSLKRLTVYLLSLDIEEIDIKIYAPKLDNLHYKGESVPRFLFSSIAPSQIELTLELHDPIGQLFFFKIREVLNLSTKFKINITVYKSVFKVPFNNDMDDVRRSFQIPAMNVERLMFESYSDKGLWESPQLLLHAFVSIMRPNYLIVSHRGNRVTIGLKFRKWCGPDLKKVEIKNGVDGKWISVTSSLESDCLDSYGGEFKLTWSSL